MSAVVNAGLPAPLCERLGHLRYECAAGGGEAAVRGALDAQRLLERAQEQEDIINCLWGRYERDVGHPPDLDSFVPDAGAGRLPSALQPVAPLPTFEQAVEAYQPRWTHSYSEAPAQRVAVQLLAQRRPAAVYRRVGDVVFRGFAGRGVCLSAFDRLLHKLRTSEVQSLRWLDLGESGLNDRFAPGVIELVRCGVRHLDLSQNSLGGAAMSQIMTTLGRFAPYLETLDLRFNPCADDPAFQRSVALAMPEFKFLQRLGIQVRCGGATQGERGFGSTQVRDWSAAAAAAPAPAAAPAATAVPAPMPGADRGRSTQQQTKRAGSTGASASTRKPGAWLPSGRRETDFDLANRLVAERQQRERTRRASSQGATVRKSHKEGGRARTPEAPSAAELAATQPAPEGPRSFRAALAQRGIGTDTAVALFRGMSQCSHLRWLDLRASQLSREAVARLANCVRAMPLVTLNLADSFLGDNVEPLLDALPSCRSLVYLNLRLNALTGHTGIELCRALDASVSLTEVDLSSNDLGDSFGQAFAKVLGASDVLWKANLSRNPLGEASGSALLEALRKNDTFMTFGDVRDGFHSLGLQNRMFIEACLSANRRGLRVEERDASTTQLGLHHFRWEIIDDPQDGFGVAGPRPCEPMLALC